MPRIIACIAATLMGGACAAAVAANSESRLLPLAPAQEPIVANGASQPPNTISLTELVAGAVVDEAVVARYKSARTVADIGIANDWVAKELVKLQLVEVELARVLATAKSCQPLVGDADLHAVVDAVAGKMTALEAALVDIERRMKSSVELMQRRSVGERRSAISFREEEEVRRYEKTYSEFGHLRVQAHDIRRSVDRTRLHARLTQCQPATIPSLYGPGIAVMAPNKKLKPQSGSPPQRRTGINARTNAQWPEWTNDR